MNDIDYNSFRQILEGREEYVEKSLKMFITFTLDWRNNNCHTDESSLALCPDRIFIFDMNEDTREYYYEEIGNSNGFFQEDLKGISLLKEYKLIEKINEISGKDDYIDIKYIAEVEALIDVETERDDCGGIMYSYPVVYGFKIKKHRVIGLVEHK